MEEKCRKQEEKNCYGQATLLMLINGKSLALTISESDFIADLKNINISRWNGYEYSRVLEDGDIWSLTISFDNRFRLRINEDNKSSLRMAEKLGAVKIPYEKSDLLKKFDDYKNNNPDEISDTTMEALNNAAKGEMLFEICYVQCD